MADVPAGSSLCGCLERELQAAVEGEVRFDTGSRALYARDASNYGQMPIGVVLPRTATDAESTMAACRLGRCTSG